MSRLAPTLEHPRAAGEHGLEAAPRSRPALRQRAISVGHGEVRELARLRVRLALGLGQHDVGEPGHAGEAVDQRQPDAGAQAAAHELVTGSAWTRRALPCAHAHRDPTVREARAAASRSFTPPASAAAGRRSSTARSVMSSSESSTSTRSASSVWRQRERRDDRAEQVGGHLRRARAASQPGHRAAAPSGRQAPRMLPISPSAESPTSVPGIDAEQLAERRPRPRLGTSSSTTPCDVALERQ